MTRIIHKNSPLIVIICVLLLTQLTGCGEDTEESDEPLEQIGNAEPPSLPPPESMLIDLSLFIDDRKASPGAVMLVTYKNFVNAAARVATINSAIVAATTPPATLFAAARANEPVQQGDGSWLWTYEQEIDHVTFTASLTAVTDAGETYWSMKVSSDAAIHPVTDFEWYNGMSTETNTSGYWEFFDMQTPEDQNRTVKIDWKVGILKENTTLAFENVDPRGEYLGDVLEYETDLEDAWMTYDDASEDNVWEIQWNIEMGSGSLSVPGYNNGEKACWNALKQDVVCE